MNTFKVGDIVTIKSKRLVPNNKNIIGIIYHTDGILYGIKWFTSDFVSILYYFNDEIMYIQ